MNPVIPLLILLVIVLIGLINRRWESFSTADRSNGSWCSGSKCSECASGCCLNGICQPTERCHGGDSVYYWPRVTLDDGVRLVDCLGIKGGPAPAPPGMANYLVRDMANPPPPPGNDGGNWTEGKATFYCWPEHGDNVCGRGMCGGEVAPGKCSLAGQVSWVKNNGLCGKNVQVKLDNGYTFVAPIYDGCPDSECAPNHLDMSGGCWQQAGLDWARGVVPISFRVLN